MSEATRKDIQAWIKSEQLYQRMVGAKPRLQLRPHERGQTQFLSSPHKIRIVIPGNGWGKTTIMAYAMDMILQRDDPYNPHLLPTAGRKIIGVWVTTKYQQFDVVRQQLEEEIWTHGWQWNQTRHFYEWPNGSQLHIVSSDSDWTHIQGIGIDVVAFDEHPEKKLWTEFQFRRRGKRKTRYMVAATMTQGMTWFVREVIQPWEKLHQDMGLTGDRARLAQKHPDIWVWNKGGIRDNPAMNDEDFRHYESIGSASDKELEVRLKGGYADFTGESVFDGASLDAMVPELKDGTDGALHLRDIYDMPKLYMPDGSDAVPVVQQRVGGKAGTNWVQFERGGMVEGGRVTVWEEPAFSSVYVIGADFAAGLVGRDYDYAVVLRKDEDGQLVQVAEAKGWWGDANFADILYRLGVWYFNAFLCGERQFGLPTLRRLYDEYGYSALYRGRHDATRSRRPSDLLGHHRSSGDTVIPNLRAAILKGSIVIRSFDLMEQLRQYQYRPRHAKADPESATSDMLITSAPQGMNDDGVMALGYGFHAAREAVRFHTPTPVYGRGTYGEIFQNAKVLRGLVR